MFGGEQTVATSYANCLIQLYYRERSDGQDTVVKSTNNITVLPSSTYKDVGRDLLDELFVIFGYC